MSLSRLVGKCAVCPFSSKCDKKKMEAFASAETTNDASNDLSAPLVVKHNYRNIKVAEDTTITIDVEELKKNLKEEFYRKAGLGIHYGA